MKQVVSISLGSSQRDFFHEMSILNTDLQIKRIGVDGDLNKAKELITQFDGSVDAIGLGGIDLYLFVGKQRFTIRDALHLASAAKYTPVVCGAGLKNSLEEQVINTLDDQFRWGGKRVLLVSSIDRFGMAKAFCKTGAEIIYGDFLFALGLPIPIYSITSIRILANFLLPVFTQLPFKWLYPVGDKQLRETPKYSWAYYWADVIAGDWHYIRKYAPEKLVGKTILTNTTTAGDVEFLRTRGVETLITTTPRIAGRSLPTNLLEAALIATCNEFPLTNERYKELIQEANLQPNILRLENL